MMINPLLIKNSGNVPKTGEADVFFFSSFLRPLLYLLVYEMLKFKREVIRHPVGKQESLAEAIIRKLFMQRCRAHMAFPVRMDTPRSEVN